MRSTSPSSSVLTTLATPAITIIVPTFNRAHCLRMLLGALKVELRGLEGRIAVVIGDNASSDGTPDVTWDFALAWADTRVLRHENNVGPEENFCRCVEQVRSTYFWIIGDDDLPRAGAIRALLELLERQKPDLLYMESRWTPTLTSHDEAGATGPLRASLNDRSTFARRVHVWTTFISGCIVRTAFVSTSSLRLYTGTSLVQLGWIFGALKQGTRFVHVATPCVLATSGASGGYAVLKVFGQNFPRIARDALSGTRALDTLAADIVSRASIAYLPNLVWDLREAKAGNFDQSESVTTTLGPELGRTLPYRLLIKPMVDASPRVAKGLLKLSHVATRIVSLLDLLHARLSGSLHAL